MITKILLIASLLFLLGCVDSKNNYILLPNDNNVVANCPNCALRDAHNDFNFDQNINNIGSTKPPLTLNSVSGTIMQRWMLNGLTQLEACNVFGFSGFCADPVNNPISFFGYSNLTGYFAVVAGGEASVLNDDVGWVAQSPYFQVSGSNPGLIVDNNTNTAQLSVSNTADIQKLKVNGDGNFILNARIKRDLYVDINIFADSYENSIPIALDTCYINGGKRDLDVYGDVLSHVEKAGDTAYIAIQTGLNCGSLNTIENTGFSSYNRTLSEKLDAYYAFEFVVHDGNAFQLTSNVAGTGTVTLDNARRFYP